ncbi:MAG: hypothetical protein FWE88_00620 [Phycisphaerae bacterium]|nr:hypothetical protein [Phycisphaerae bacterium]
MKNVSRRLAVLRRGRWNLSLEPMMRIHPERVILVGCGGCLIIGGTLFVSGILLDTPILKSIAWWFWIAAIIIGWGPPLVAIVIVAVGNIIEKYRRK